MPDNWIDVPGWDRFQHYSGRRPLWIKNYTELLHKDEYLELTMPQRGLLHGIWLAYADNNGLLKTDRLHQVLDDFRTDSRSLLALEQAGFIEILLAKPLSLISLEHTRAREAAPRGVVQARHWIENGAAREIPTDRLAEVLADEFRIDDASAIADLVALARERNP